jgi:hypothetical protein
MSKNAKPWDMITSDFVDQETYEKRLSECFSCDRLIKITTQCKECGCFMMAKTKLPHAFCPIGKWQSVEKD